MPGDGWPVIEHVRSRKELDWLPVTRHLMIEQNQVRKRKLVPVTILALSAKITERLLQVLRSVDWIFESRFFKRDANQRRIVPAILNDQDCAGIFHHDLAATLAETCVPSPTPTTISKCCSFPRSAH